MNQTGLNQCSICLDDKGELLKHCCCEYYSHIECIKSFSTETKCYICKKTYVNQKILNNIIIKKGGVIIQGERLFSSVEISFTVTDRREVETIYIPLPFWFSTSPETNQPSVHINFSSLNLTNSP